MADQPNQSSNNVVSLLSKKASFVQHSLPGLRAGKYEITVQQELDYPDGTSNPQNPLPGKMNPVTKKFGVEAPKYTLDLNQDIHAVFPPLGSANEYSNDLPHIVLKNEKTPWMRSPYIPTEIPAVKENTYPNPGTCPVIKPVNDIVYDDDMATWMAVMLFSPSDFNGTDPQKLIQTGTVQDLIPNSKTVANPGGSPQNGNLDNSPPDGAKRYSIFSYFLETAYINDINNDPNLSAKQKQDILNGPIDPGIGFHYNDPVKYIDIPVSLFNAIAPSLEDLNMMAHVREVVMSDKPIPYNMVVKPQESYGLVIGNRLPESFPQPTGEPVTGPPKGQNVAMAVSLENMQYALGGHVGASYFDTNIKNDPNGFVRFPVLYAWSFVSWFDTAASFENLMKGLNGRNPLSQDGPSVPVPNPLMRIPNPPNYPAGSTDDKTIIQDMLELGYVPFNHITRVPNDKGPVQTVSWYRGPLIPFEKDTSVLPPFVNGTDPATGKPAVYSADALLRFDPNIGMYDVSYAAAWQLGRLLALSDKSFSVPLYQWKKQVEEQYRMILESEVLKDQYSDLLELYKDIVEDESQNPGAQISASLMVKLKSFATGLGKK